MNGIYEFKIASFGVANLGPAISYDLCLVFGDLDSHICFPEPIRRSSR